VRLDCSYANRNSNVKFDVDLIETIAAICHTVKGGVLCFLPSYSMLNSIDKRKLEKALRGKKKLLFEPRQSTGLESIFQQHRRAVLEPTSTCDGALLLGVYRGKVSEGIDFADEMARCVIAVGIPLPSYVDPQVREKRIFNDRMRAQNNSKTISGSDWYKMEGYRALNQALGRCLRHRKDWGVLLLVESRIVENAKRKSGDFRLISRWIQDVLQPHDDFQEVLKGVRVFCDSMRRLDEKRDEESGYGCG